MKENNKLIIDWNKLMLKNLNLKIFQNLKKISENQTHFILVVKNKISFLKHILKVQWLIVKVKKRQ